MIKTMGQSSMPAAETRYKGGGKKGGGKKGGGNKGGGDKGGGSKDPAPIPNEVWLLIIHCEWGEEIEMYFHPHTTILHVKQSCSTTSSRDPTAYGIITADGVDLDDASRIEDNLHDGAEVDLVRRAA